MNKLIKRPGNKDASQTDNPGVPATDMVKEEGGAPSGLEMAR